MGAEVEKESGLLMGHLPTEIQWNLQGRGKNMQIFEEEQGY